MFTQRFLILLTLVAFTQAAQHAKCTAAEFVDPSTLKSSAEVCKAVVAGAKTAMAEDATAGFDPNSVGGDRGGKEIFDDLLGGNTPSSDKLAAYGQAVAILAAPAVLFFFLNFCCCWCCTCCHTSFKLCCPNNCHLCKCTPRTDREYTKLDGILPVLVWTIISLLMCGFAIAGIVQGIYKMNDATVNSVCLIDDAYLRFNGFLNNVKAPLGSLNTNFGKAVEKLTEAAVQDAQLAQNVVDIGAKFDILKQQAMWNKANVTYRALNPELKSTCDKAWDKVIKTCEDAKAETDASGKEVNKALTDVQETIQSSIVDQSAAATDALSAGQDTISSTQKQVGELMNPRKMGGQNLFTFAEQVKSNRDASAFAFYGWVPIVVMFGFIAIAAMKFFNDIVLVDLGDVRGNQDMGGKVKKLTHLGACCSRFGTCSWCLTLFFGIFCAFFAIFFIPFAAVGSDACLVIPSLPTRMGELSGNAQIGQITDTCWNKTGNLFEGLELDKSIDLNAINFTDFNEQFANNKVVIDKSGLDDLKEALAQVADECYEKIPSTKDYTVGLVDGKIRPQIEFAENAFDTNPSIETLNTAGKQLISVIKCAVEDFKTGTSCYFIKTTWEQAVAVLCEGFIGSIGWVGASELFLAVIAIPYAITLMCLMKREGGHGPIVTTKGDDDDEFADSKDMGSDDGMVTVDAEEVGGEGLEMSQNPVGDKYA